MNKPPNFNGPGLNYIQLVSSTNNAIHSIPMLNSQTTQGYSPQLVVQETPSNNKHNPVTQIYQSQIQSAQFPSLTDSIHQQQNSGAPVPVPNINTSISVPLSNYTSSDEEYMENEGDNKNQHSWQSVTKKRKRTKLAKPNNSPPQITTANRFQLLPNLDHNDNSDEPTNHSNTPKPKEPNPPPIYVYGVINYKDMIDNLAVIVPEESYFTKTFPDNTVKINAYTSDAYRKLIHHLREGKIIHHSYQPKQERAYRVVIRNLHCSTPLEEITHELGLKGHKVRNVINVRHRISKNPLPLFFVDLEPQRNNKDIFELEFIKNTKMRCQAYGHSKAYCTKPFNCVKCAGSHDTKSCSKSNETPATCVLCDGAHPANYKGCTVYRDLIKARYKENAKNHNNLHYNKPLHQQMECQQQNTISYAQATAANTNNSANSVDANQNLTSIMSTFLNEFKAMFTQLLNQNNTILTMLSTVIGKITK